MIGKSCIRHRRESLISLTALAARLTGRHDHAHEAIGVGEAHRLARLLGTVLRAVSDVELSTLAPSETQNSN